MKFLIAKRELAKIAKGQYHSLRYELSQYSKKTGSRPVVECAVYIHGFSWHREKNWKEALKQIRKEVNITQQKIDPTEAPDII